MAMTSRHARAPGGEAAPGTVIRVDTTCIGAHLLVAVSGEADHYTAEGLRGDLRAALAGEPGSMTLDVSGLEFCDLAGLAALHDFTAEAAAAGVPTDVQGMSPLLEWMHATFPGVHGSRARTSGPVAPPDLPLRRESSVDAAHVDPVRTEPAAPPRSWPER